MSNVYLQNGTRYSVMDGEAVSVHSALPSGVYTVIKTMFGYELERTEGFTLPKKIYGDVVSTAMRVFNTHESRQKSTGVLLSGLAGAGKTMTVKEISRMASERGYVTVLVNRGFSDDGFKKLIASIDQPAVIVFDEFEKVYDSWEQEQILTMLDGVFETDKLFLFTCNHVNRVDRHMLNRPGRIHYAIKYDGLSSQAISEYCTDNLKNKAHIQGVETVMKTRGCNNFDVLTALVGEMNLYNEDAETAAKLMNIGW